MIRVLLASMALVFAIGPKAIGHESDAVAFCTDEAIETQWESERSSQQDYIRECIADYDQN